MMIVDGIVACCVSHILELTCRQASWFAGTTLRRSGLPILQRNGIIGRLATTKMLKLLLPSSSTVLATALLAIILLANEITTLPEQLHLATMALLLQNAPSVHVDGAAHAHHAVGSQCCDTSIIVGIIIITRRGGT